MKKFISAMLACFMLAGCGSASSTATAAASEGAAQGSMSDSSEKVQVEFWYSGGKTAVGVVQEIIDSFNASQDQYEVTAVTQADYDETYQKLQAAIAGNAAPDLVLLDASPTRQLYEKGLIQPIDDYNNADPEFSASNYVSTFYEQGTSSDGTQFALPAYGTTQVLYYNVQAFADAGVDPASIKTWQDLAEAAQKIKETGKYEYGWEPMWGVDNLIDAAFSNGAEVFSDDGKTVTINSDEWVEVWESFRKWIHDDQIMGIHSGGQGWEYWYATIDDVLQNKAGGYTGSSGDQADLDFTIVQAMEQPAWDDDSESAPMAEALLMSAVKGGSEAEMQGAYEFMRYFTDVDAQIKWNETVGYVAVNKKILENSDYQSFLKENPQAAVPLSQADHGSIYPVDPTNGKVYDALKIAADKVEIDGTDAKEALDEAQKTAQEALDAALAG